MKISQEFVKRYPNMFIEDKEWWAEQLDLLIESAYPQDTGEREALEFAVRWAWGNFRRYPADGVVDVCYTAYLASKKEGN